MVLISVATPVWSDFDSSAKSPQDFPLFNLTSKPKIEKLWQSAIQAEALDARKGLADFLLKQPVVTPDYSRVVELLQYKTKTGDLESIIGLGDLLSDEKIKLKNQSEAFQLYKKAEAGGYVPAFVRLGEIYERGIGVPNNINRAADYYERAAASGSPQAKARLGILYLQNANIFDRQRVVNLLKDAAVAGNAEGLYTLARVYWEGNPLDAILKNLCCCITGRRVGPEVP